jgi:hypothetical protein
MRQRLACPVALLRVYRRNLTFEDKKMFKKIKEMV